MDFLIYNNFNIFVKNHFKVKIFKTIFIQKEQTFITI